MACQQCEVEANSDGFLAVGAANPLPVGSTPVGAPEALVVQAPHTPTDFSGLGSLLRGGR